MSEIIHGEALPVLRSIPDHTFDACVTDPPYGLKFMGNRWDYDVPSVELWSEVLRVLKPGAHLTAFGGSRTYHRLACNVEDAGFELRDQIMWLYGSGYPKTKHVLKPAHEPIVLARKPFDGRLADNLANVGTGALSIEACRLGYLSDADRESATPQGKATMNKNAGRRPGLGKKLARHEYKPPEQRGRWPANVMLGCGCETDQHDADCAVTLLDAQSGILTSNGRSGGHQSKKTKNVYGSFSGSGYVAPPIKTSTGGASRFYYCAKATPEERGSFNSHPTVKPLALMRYLVRLTVPQGGKVLDPFAGSGTTVLACRMEERACVAIEREEEHCEIARKRLAQGVLFAPEAACT